MSDKQLLDSPLGKQTLYVSEYDPAQLYSIERQNSWQRYAYKSAPYYGCDIWNAYELSWLNKKGLPVVAIAEVWIPLGSPRLIESKSFKLYLNSFNQTKFDQREQVCKILETDLSACAGAAVKVNLFSVSDERFKISELEGGCLDQLDITIEKYMPDENLLWTKNNKVSNEKVYSHLLKSNCPITGQPDWASIYIDYSGQEIDPESLLKYIVSYRDQGDFHEQCTEKIFLDIMQQCQPEELTVYTRYLRRGGLDINPYRSTRNELPVNLRLLRQ